MFVRWLKKGNKRYATLEERFYEAGKVKSKSIAYLGKYPVAKLAELAEAGTISREDYERLKAKLPPDPPKDPLHDLLKDLDGLTERAIMAEIPDLSTYMNNIDGVRRVLGKLEAIKGKYQT